MRGGLKSHFGGRKATLSTPRNDLKSTSSSFPSKLAAPIALPVTASNAVAKAVDIAEEPVKRTTRSTSTLRNAAQKADSPIKTEQRTRSTRTQLRTPKKGEVESILADFSEAKASSAAVQPGEGAGKQRLTTPEPPVPDPTSPYLLGTPPRTRSRRIVSPTKSVKAKLPSSSSSPSKPVAHEGAAPNLIQLTSSPIKRKARDSDQGLASSPTPSSPTKMARFASPSQASSSKLLDDEVGGNDVDDDDDDDDGLVLTPGRLGHPRLAVTSPKAPHINPLSHRSPTAALPRQIARRIMEDEDNYLTPRSVRERPKGQVPQLLPMASGVAVFQPGPSRRADSLATPSTSRIQKDLFTPTREEATPSKPVARVEEELPELRHPLSSSLPLPKHYASLLTLHVALEHALVVHLATSGASMASLSAQDASNSSDDEGEADGSLLDGMRSKTVRLPNLATYSALRPLVERSGGRRFSPTELARLANVWIDFAPRPPSGSDEVQGLGFLVTRTRTLDASGRRVWDWGIGIQLEVTRPRRQKTPPVQVGFQGVVTDGAGDVERVTPPPSPAPSQASPSPSKSVSRSAARDNMSFVALWNNGIEARKAQVARRLRVRCGRWHQKWLDEQGIEVVTPPPMRSDKVEEPTTPTRESKGKAMQGEGGLWTPSHSRSGKHAERIVKLPHGDATDDDDDERARRSVVEDEVRLTPRSGVVAPSAPVTVSASPSKQEGDRHWNVGEGGKVDSWHPEFPLDSLTSVPAVPLMTLPSLQEPATPSRNKTPSRSAATPTASTGLGITLPALLSTTTTTPRPSTPTTPSTSGLTLKERILQKQLLKTPSTASTAAGRASLSRRSTLSRLPELASILFMLFASRATLPMAEVVTAACKSLSTPLSRTECRAAIDALGETAKGFLEVSNVAGREWVRMGKREGRRWELGTVRQLIAEADRAAV
ncbi:hypothetical protein ACQY0O_003269 [Thecaphora frezii]